MWRKKEVLGDDLNALPLAVQDVVNEDFFFKNTRCPGHSGRSGAVGDYHDYADQSGPGSQELSESPGRKCPGSRRTGFGGCLCNSKQLERGS
jgi:hypothetical protein